MRYGLLLAAATTVAVPGLLAALGVVGHDHVAATAATAAQAAAAGTAVLSGPFPVAPSTARAGVRNDVAGVQRTSGPTVTVFSQLSGRQQALGRKLLAQAARAGQALSYQGTERISQDGVDGRVSLTSTVWHEGGSQILVRRTASGTAVAPAGTVADPASASPEGVLGITRSLVALQGQHYVAVYAGSGSAAGRAAAVVELYHFNGTLAARYWLDRQTTLPLRRELFGSSNQVISDDAFTRVALGSSAGAAPADEPATPAQTAWVTAASAARFRAALAAEGWQLPSTLSGGLPLYAAAWTATATGKVVDLEYSDGLYTVSIFVQPGQLAGSLPVGQRMLVGGQRAYVSGHSVTWAGPGLVYTMIADAPAQTVEEVVAALPAGHSPGVLDRMRRGLGRLARVADPFS
jgi:sigma-E factor negative regulatory protein RseB